MSKAKMITLILIITIITISGVIGLLIARYDYGRAGMATQRGTNLFMIIIILCNACIVLYDLLKNGQELKRINKILYRLHRRLYKLQIIFLMFISYALIHSIYIFTKPVLTLYCSQ